MTIEIIRDSQSLKKPYLNNDGLNHIPDGHFPFPSGFEITFENGITISVQFGQSAYCENKTPSKNAEIAVTTEDDAWYLFEEEVFSLGETDVKGHCDPDTIAEHISYFKNLSKQEIKILTKS